MSDVKLGENGKRSSKKSGDRSETGELEISSSNGRVETGD